MRYVVSSPLSSSVLSHRLEGEVGDTQPYTPPESHFVMVAVSAGLARVVLPFWCSVDPYCPQRL